MWKYLFIMDNRQQTLLNLVIENYIETAEPVGSKFLVSAGELDLSEATVRNELRVLEEEEYLTHPHTSAGRMPTEKGYRYYIDHLDLENFKTSKHDANVLCRSIKDNDDHELSRKHLAKALAELASEAVILAFSLEKVYYTGLANLFHKPEFRELKLVIDVSSVFDHCEACLKDFFEMVDLKPKYFIGDEHPFGSALSVLSFRFGKGRESLVALLGPKRMDYRHNYELMKKAAEVINE